MTVKFASIANFGYLNHHDAERIVYDQLLHCCETNSVFLSEFGNNESPNAHPAFGGLSSKEEYYRKKTEHSLFDIERIQRVFRALDGCIQEASQFKSSGPLKNRITTHLDEAVPEGEFIVAMMVKGYFARFAKRCDPLNVDCEFRALPKQLPL